MVKLIVKIMIVSMLLATELLNAQEFSGQAIYETKTQMDGSVKLSSPDMTEEMRKRMEERINKAFEKTFILNFNKHESVYTEEQKMEAPAPRESGMRMVVNSGGEKIYKNVKEKISVSEEEFLGKEFLILDSLMKWDWKLESETKKIGNYTCYKAVAVVPVSEDAKKAYEENKAKKKEGKTQFITISEPKEQVITVWYTPEIPVSQGPATFWGLPGLILEANDGRTTFLCSKIILNPKEKTEIKRPTKGKKVNRKEFEEITMKQLEKMQDSKGNIHIQIGG